MNQPKEEDDLNSSAIAIVGMAGRFPGAPNIDEFWHNLRNRVESTKTFTDEELLASGVDPGALCDPKYVKSKPVLEGVELFDASFFGFSPKEAFSGGPMPDGR